MAPPVPDPTEVEAARAALQQAFDKLRKGVDACVSEFNHVVDQINKYGAVIGAIGLYLIKKNIEEIRKHLKKALDVAKKVLNGGVPVLSLFLTSIDYINVVYRPAGDISALVSKPADDNLQYWVGGAGAAYRQKQAEQKVAVDKSVENAAFMSTWLFKIGQTNVNYAAEIVKVIVDAGSELVNITVDGLSIINIQFSLDHAADAIKKLIKAGINMLIDLANKFVATLGDCRDLLEKRSAHSAFPKGSWPQAVYTF